MGVVSPKRLAVELMGRSCNLVLVGADGRIIDCLRRVDMEQSEQRQLLPGLLYRLPPSQDKADFLALGSEGRLALWREAPPDAAADQWLLDSFSGLSPLVCRELCFRAFNDVSPRKSALGPLSEKAFGREMDALADRVAAGSYEPLLLMEEDRPRDFSFMPVRQYGKALKTETYPDFSSLLDTFYTRREKAEGLRRRARELRRTVETTHSRLLRKIDAQERELKKTGDREQLRRRGDLITANIYRLKKGMRSFTAPDYATEGAPEAEVALDPLKTPQQNAAACYKAYAKAKTAEGILTRELSGARSEAAYLESVLDEMERAETERDLGEIRLELMETGYLRERQEKKRRKAQPSTPLRFRSETGLTILVGRSNLQNDELTLHTARRTDLWLHTQKIHGSHVVVLCGDREADDTTLRQAASLAAFYSQGRAAGCVAVDYTMVRNVRKPAGARPGTVIYTQYKTILAEADPALAERLLIK
jgi:predicted ribosome quality control (RQC) complex YloA/Tae2 family protein